MDKTVLLTLNKALEEAKPYVTRDSWSPSLRRSYILLRLACRAARRQKLSLCRTFVDLAIPGFSRNVVPVSADLMRLWKYLDQLLQAA